MDPINPIAGNPEALNQTPVQQSPSIEPTTNPTVPVQPKGRWLTSVALLFVGLLLGVGGVLAYQKLPNVKQETPVPSPTSWATPDPTADWITYTNSKYNYSFKYPAGWSITFEDDQTFSNVTISSQTGKSVSAIHFEGKPETDKTNWTKNFVLDTNDYIMVEFAHCEGKPAPGTSCGGAVTLEDINTFNQILSTFKFADNKVDTSSWKVYSNPDDRYSFKHPSNISVNYNPNQKSVINIIGLGGNVSITTEPLSNNNLMQDKNHSDNFVINGITWKYLTGDAQYCDAGECSSLTDALQTTNGNYRYTVILGNITYPNETLNQILSTFKFTQ